MTRPERLVIKAFCLLGIVYGLACAEPENEKRIVSPPRDAMKAAAPAKTPSKPVAARPQAARPPKPRSAVPSPIAAKLPTEPTRAAADNSPRPRNSRTASGSHQYLGADRSGDYGKAGILTRWPPSGPKKLWQIKVGEGYSAPVVADGRLYLLTLENNEDVVRCVDAATGQEKWKRAYDGAYKNKFGNGPRATPLIDGNRLYTLGGKGHLHCWDARSGKIIWRTNILKRFGAKNLRWGVSCSPLIEGNYLYVNTGGPGASLVALHKETGKVLWKSQSDTAGYASPQSVTIGAQRQIVFFTKEGLVSVDPTKGNVFWRYPWKTHAGVNAAMPRFVGTRFLVSTGYGTGCALVDVSRDRPRELWKSKELASHITTPIIHQGHAFGFDGKTGSGQCILKCIDLKTGRKTWGKRGFRGGQLILVDEHLIILSQPGELILAEARADRYVEKGRVQVLSGKCWTVPVLADGRLFVRNEKVLIALDVTGKHSK